MRGKLFTVIVGLTLVANAFAGSEAWSTGEFVKTKDYRVVIRHTGIPALDMPPMQMAFKVDESYCAGCTNTVSQLMEKDKVKFVATKLNGSYVIVKIEKND